MLRFWKVLVHVVAHVAGLLGAGLAILVAASLATDYLIADSPQFLGFTRKFIRLLLHPVVAVAIFWPLHLLLRPWTTPSAASPASGYLKNLAIGIGNAIAWVARTATLVSAPLALVGTLAVGTVIVYVEVNEYVSGEVGPWLGKLAVLASVVVLGFFLEFIYGRWLARLMARKSGDSERRPSPSAADPESPGPISKSPLRTTTLSSSSDGGAGLRAGFVLAKSAIERWVERARVYGPPLAAVTVLLKTLPLPTKPMWSLLMSAGMVFVGVFLFRRFALRFRTPFPALVPQFVPWAQISLRAAN